MAAGQHGWNTTAAWGAAGLLLVAGLFGTAHAQAPLPVTVTLLPQRFFVERIGGPHVRVTVMVPPGADAHTYEPRPRQMAELSRSRLYFAVGDPFESIWLAKFKAANRELPVVNTDAGIEKLPMTDDDDEHGHAHPAASGAGSQAGLRDPHIWLSPPLVKIQAAHIRDGLVGADPAHRADYEANYGRFVQELDALDGELRGIFQDLKPGQREFMIFHPAWGYFAQAYGLVQAPIEVHGKDPRPAQLARLIDHARERGIRAIFVQPQRSTRAAETIAKAIGGAVVVADDLAPDWAENLRRVAVKMRDAAR
jgi:zinc transport system substrate-binding protein